MNMGLNFAKDANKAVQAKNDLRLPEMIRAVFSETVNAWINATVEMNRAIFNGDDRSLRMVGNLLKDGNSLEREALNVNMVKPPAERLLYSLLILDTWRMQGYSPVLLYTAHDCNKMGVGTSTWTTAKDLQGLARVCYKGLQYHMLAVRGSYGCSTHAQPGAGTPASVDCNKVMSVPPGLKDIRVDRPLEEWGGLNLYTMINR